MKNVISAPIVILLCLPLTGCGVLIGAGIGAIAGGAAGGIIGAASTSPTLAPKTCETPYPVEYKKGKSWMKNCLMCPKGKKFPLRGAKSKDAVRCPYHNQQINVEEGRKRYYYYYYNKKEGKPVPQQYLTEQDKEKISEKLKNHQG